MYDIFIVWILQYETYDGISAPKCKINHVNMQDNYVDMHVTNCFIKSDFIWVKWLTNAGF